jgi:hypothetical protein
MATTEFGRRKFTKAAEAAKTNVDPRDWRVGRKGNKALKPEVDANLHVFFEEMQELSAPRATRIVQDETGNGLREFSS